MGTHVKGFEVVMRNLNAEIKAMKIRSMKGLIEATIIIRRGTETQEPKVPVDTGNLRNSWFTTSSYYNCNPYVQFGFAANYALWVHEMVDADFTSPRPRYDKRTGKTKLYTPRKGAGAKFFSSAIVDNIDKIKQAIYQETQIKR